MVRPGSGFGLLLPFLLWVGIHSGVAFHFASYIDSYMVLQKEPAGAVIWGYGIPGAIVTVTLHVGQETIMTKVTNVKAPSNIWMVILDPMKPGGPYELVAHQTLGIMRFTRKIHDILFGDVWLCSGQSNMQMTVLQIFNATEELSNTEAYQSVRLLSVSLVQSEKELEDFDEVDLEWSKPTSGKLGHGNFTYMSALCWLFGRHLYETLQYPIGLISSSWGGTPIEAWSSPRSLRTCGVHFKSHIPESVTGPSRHSVLWNAMIHPLRTMTLKGVIWYQGESNMEYNRDKYNCTFPELIADWRQSFHDGSQGQTERFFPFGFVQLSSYLVQETSDDRFPQIRWHQTADFGFVPNPAMPNTFMAVSMDLGDRDSPFGSIHPRDKQTVAYRLHLGARAVAYGEKDVIFQGPLPEKLDLVAHGELLNITYHQYIQIHVQKLKNRTFEIACCKDHHCKWLPAIMRVFSSHTLTLDILSCTATVAALRYAWATWSCEYKQCPLYDYHTHLPAPPFIAWTVEQGC
ncbi:sialate O-acetylesterase [Perognathus longimembris pacificus]|uniref:sialate O-acetylesterase n=1 Tax=Perognathus longimembris pacificus TaxID=214514 RepID=UPI0020189C6C|nr:sialate O-acetylesterase [Perognathus longimembris pacificus]